MPEALRLHPAALVAVVLAALVAGAPAPAVAQAAKVTAGQAQARDAARQANCTPTKIEVLRYVRGREPETVFKVNCSELKDAAVLVQCRTLTCVVMR